jgi:hypothetical protein
VKEAEAARTLREWAGAAPAPYDAERVAREIEDFDAAVAIESPGPIIPIGWLSAPDGNGDLAEARPTITINPSLVMEYRAGRNPLRSRVVARNLPSVKARAAGPSHGSLTQE